MFRLLRVGTGLYRHKLLFNDFKTESACRQLSLGRSTKLLSQSPTLPVATSPANFFSQSATLGAVSSSDTQLSSTSTILESKLDPSELNNGVLHSDPAQTLSDTATELPLSDVIPQFTSPFDVETTDFVSNLTEPSFIELGLSSGWPPGMVQTLMEFFHVDLGMPWWQVIAASAVVLRTMVFPLVIIAQKNMVVINNNQPEIQKLQVEAELARIRGEQDKLRFANHALNSYFKLNNCHPSKALWPVLVQGGCFMSMFFAIRGMCEAPVPSLATGGLYWFTDLIAADPHLLLPVLTCTTIYIQIYLGADGLDSSNMPAFMKKLMYVLPLISLPIMTQFPAALNVYWLSNNIISVVQARVVRLPAVRQKLGIGEMIHWNPNDLPMTTLWDQLNAEAEKKRKSDEKRILEIERDKNLKLEEELKKRRELIKALEEEDKKIK